MDLLIVLVVVALGLLPIVLVCGFAGCTSFGSEVPSTPSPPNAPEDLSATAVSTTQIDLMWTDKSAGTAAFRIQRQMNKPGGTIEDLPGDAPATPPPFHDASLQPGTSYSYRVRAVVPGTNIVSVLTSNWATAVTFQPTPPPPPPAWQLSYNVPLTADDGDFRGDCLVQRIDKAKLASGGSRVQLTLRGSLNTTLAIDRIFISQPEVPGAPGNPMPNLYDSASDLKEVRPAGVVLRPALNPTQPNPITLDPFDYALDNTRDLIVAMNINAAAGAGRKATVPGSTLHVKTDLREAEKANRSAGYLPKPNSVYVVEKLDVWTGPSVASPPTPVWQTAYSVPLATDGTDYRGATLVQRIDKAHLSSGGNRVRLTIRAATNGAILVNRLFISKAAEPSATNPTPSLWDSALDIKEIRPGGVSLPASAVVTLDPFDYVLDKTKDLIVAFDVNGTVGAVRRVAVVGPKLFTKPGIQEAQVADRTAGYTLIADTVFLIEKIEVATV
jgi:hypothetical protein